MSEKVKNSDEIKFSVLQQTLFYGVWLLTGLIGTAVFTGLAVGACVTYARDTVYALFAGNIGNLILNLIAFGILGLGLSAVAIIASVVGLYLPWNYFSKGETETPMKEIRQFIVRRRFGSSERKGGE